MEEVWMPIIGYDNHFAISNKGKVKSIAEGIENRQKVIIGDIKEVMPHENNSSYRIVWLGRDRRTGIRIKSDA